MSAVFWIALIVAAWGLLPAAVAGRKVPGFPLLAAWSVFGVLLLVLILDGDDLAKYANDSLFTLQPLEQLGVVALAGIMMGIGGWLAFRLARHLSARLRGPMARVLGLLANLVVTLAGYLAAWLVSPQVFYTYYRAIIPELPAQWVVRGGEDLTAFAGALRLRGDDSLALTAAGAFFWALAALTISVHATLWRTGHHRRPD